MNLKEVDLNDTVYFKLTLLGEKRKSEVDKHFCEVSEGLYDGQLWDICNFFKSNFGWGSYIEFILYIDLESEIY